MNMKLKELIEKTTPGPIKSRSTSNCYPFIESQSGEKLAKTDCSISSGPWCRSEEMAAHNALRLAHSYNVLPEVVEALDRLRDASKCYCQPESKPCAHCDALRVLTKANTIIL